MGYFDTTFEIDKAFKMKSYAWEKRAFLKKFHRCKKSQKLHLIKGCGKGEVLAICELIDNVIRNPQSLTTRQIKRLQNHREVCEFLADKTIPWEEKQSFLISELEKEQTGDGIPAIIAGVSAGLPLMYDFFKGLFGSSTSK